MDDLIARLESLNPQQEDINDAAVALRQFCETSVMRFTYDAVVAHAEALQAEVDRLQAEIDRLTGAKAA